MKADNEAPLAKNESAIDRLVASNEKAIGELRTDMEKNMNTITMRIIGVITLAVGLQGVFIAYLQFFR